MLLKTRFRSRFVLFLGVSWLLCPQNVGHGAALAKPPDAAAQADAEKLINGLFKADYADPAKRAKLPLKLLGQAKQSKEEPAALYVLLREARDLAAKAGDLQTAATAVEMLIEWFDVNEWDLQTALLDDGARFAKTPEATSAGAKIALKLVDHLVSIEDFKAANKYISLAADLGKRSGDKGLQQAVKSKESTVKSVAVAWARAESARKQLASTPDDPAANATWGKYVCFIKGDWASGLPFLAKGADPQMKSAASLELQDPQNSTARLGVADAWWALAESSSDAVAKSELYRRAGHWYEAALPELTGLKKTVAVERIAQVAKANAKTGKPLLNLIDVGKDSVAGKWERRGETLNSSGKGESRIEFPYRPPEEYDYALDFTFSGSHSTVIQILTARGIPFIWVMSTADDATSCTFLYIRDTGDSNQTKVKRAALIKGQRYRSVVKVRRDGAQAFIDGALISEWKTDFQDAVKSASWSLRDDRKIGIGAGDGQVTFQAADVVEVAGVGERTR